MVTEVQGIRTHAAEVANARIAAERQRGADQQAEEISHTAKNTVPKGMMAGLMKGVEHEKEEISPRALQPTKLG